MTAITDPDGNTTWRPTHRHYKGGLYRFLFTAYQEHDMTPLAVYEARSGDKFTRPLDEFNDGRFTPLGGMEQWRTSVTNAPENTYYLRETLRMTISPLRRLTTAIGRFVKDAGRQSSTSEETVYPHIAYTVTQQGPMGDAESVRFVPLPQEVEGTLEHMPINDFFGSVACGALNIYEGDGCWATATHYDPAHSVWHDTRPLWATHVVWFHK